MPESGEIQKRTVAGGVADAIRQRIIRGDLAPGAPIRQELVAHELGVSRIPLREALAQLAAEGFVSLSPHRGAVVAQLSAAEIEELLELRALLEGDLLRRAVPNMREADFATLDAILDEGRAASRAGGPARDDWPFLETLFAPAERPVTLKLLRRVEDGIDRYRQLLGAAREGGDDERALADLAGLCRERDTDGAGRILARRTATALASLAGMLLRLRPGS